jgi:hypothetical protein
MTTSINEHKIKGLQGAFTILIRENSILNTNQEINPISIKLLKDCKKRGQLIVDLV